MAEWSTYELRRGGAEFRSDTRTVSFRGEEFAVTVVRIFPPIEHATRVGAGGDPFAGTLKYDKDES